MVNLSPDFLEQRPHLNLATQSATVIWLNQVVNARIVRLLDFRSNPKASKKPFRLRIPGICFRRFAKNPISTRYLIHDGHMDVFKLILMQMQSTRTPIRSVICSNRFSFVTMIPFVAFRSNLSRRCSGSLSRDLME